jgi:8-oxo-dGTP diphosphatase
LAFSLEKLSGVLRPVSDEQDANAAVALVLRSRGGRLYILLVRRIWNPRDPWSGQISLPGGKREAEDGNLRETVMRETLEETNISLMDHCRFLGVMSTFRTTSQPEIKVLPFVMLIEEEPSVRLNREELEEYFWVPVDELIENRATERLSLGEFPAFAVRGITIWGLTYRIVEALIRCLPT